MRKIVLISGSPRRRALLVAAQFDVAVIVPDADETWPDPDRDPELGVVTLARRKSDSVPIDVLAGRALSVAADTVVVLDGEPLGKPRDEADAIGMLGRLSGGEHAVITGFCVRLGERRIERAVRTRVWFRSLCQGEIERYVATGEAMDKAGGYGIQGAAGPLVDRVEGSYTNVVGLPLAEVIAACEELQR